MTEDREARIVSALRALAAEDAGREAPPRVEAALMEAFDRRHGARRPVARLGWLAAAAAVLVALGAGMWARRERPVEPPRAVVVLPSVPRFATEQPAVSAASTDMTTAYLLLPYTSGAPADGLLPVVRMRVPQAVLVSFGLPMNPDASAGTVEADVVLDNAGMARAIRFVR